MKVAVVSQEAFKPITVQFTIETPRELEDMKRWAHCLRRTCEKYPRRPRAPTWGAIVDKIAAIFPAP